MKEALTQVLTKVTSGRWLFTLALAIVFCWTSINGTMSPDDTSKIIMVGLTFYFTKKSENGG